MQQPSINALSGIHPEKARSSSAGSSATTVYGDHSPGLRQTLIALAAGESLAEHESPGEATLQVLLGRVQMTAGDDTWEGSAGDLAPIPSQRHGLLAVEDAVFLLTVRAH